MGSEEWRSFTVQQLVDEGMLEKPFDGNHGAIHPKASDYVSIGIPFIMANDLVGGKVDYNSCHFISCSQANSLKKGFAKPGDVLLTHKATIGRTAIVGGEYPSIILTPQVTYYRVKKGINKRYLKYYFDSNSFQQLFQNWSGAGSTRAYLGITEQLKLPIVLPSLAEQNFIAATLSSLDDKIELNNRIIANLEAQAQAIFKSWFVDFEPFQDGEFEESELGLIPKGWRVGTFSNLGNIEGGSTPSKSEPSYYCKNGIPWITPRDLSSDKRKFIDRGANDITESGLKNSSAKILPAGTVLFSSRAPIGYITIAKNAVSTNQGFKSVVPFKQIGTAYVYYYLKQNTDRIIAAANGSTFKEISGTVLKNLPAIIPEAQILKDFSTFCETFFKQQAILEEQNGTLVETRDTLLPKLMSGEIEVPVEG